MVASPLTKIVPHVVSVALAACAPKGQEVFTTVRITNDPIMIEAAEAGCVAFSPKHVVHTLFDEDIGVEGIPVWADGRG